MQNQALAQLLVQEASWKLSFEAPGPEALCFSSASGGRF